MTAALALARYRQTDLAGQAVADDPHEVIFVTLRELNRALAVLHAATKAGRPAPADHANRALTALYILQSSLDFEKGGDIANDLFAVYEFARQQVLAIWSGETETDIETAHAALEDIQSAWTQIGAQPSRAAV
jgi:flagellar protein FliS